MGLILNEKTGLKPVCLSQLYKLVRTIKFYLYECNNQCSSYKYKEKECVCIIFYGAICYPFFFHFVKPPLNC